MELLIKSDSNGQIWLATKTGLIYRYDILKDEFQLIHQFKQKASDQNNISSPRGIAFHITPGNVETMFS